MRELEWNGALLTTALISGADVSMSAFKPQGDILNIHCDIFAKTLLTVINYIKIYYQTRHLFQIVGSFLTFTFHKVV